MRSLLVTVTLFLAGCASRTPQADLDRLYGERVRANHRSITPVIVIPGFLGSKLVDAPSGRVVWGVFENDYASTDRAEDLQLFALDLEQGGAIGRQKSRVQPRGVLDSIEFRALGVPLEQRAYAGIMQTLGLGGFVDEQMGRGMIDWGSEHFTCFQFDYDWRLSCAQNAARLDRFIHEKQKYIRSESKKIYGEDPGEVKFNIVAHSLGGLIARYYARYGSQPLGAAGALPRLDWRGARNIEKLVLVGTPNSGTVLALQDLRKGKTFLPSWQRRLLGVNLPEFDAAILGSYPSLYEVLPRQRHERVLDLADDSPLDTMDPGLWQSARWGLSSAKAESTLAKLLPGKDPATRKLIARSYQQACLRNADRFHRALDRRSTPPREFDIYGFTGDAEETFTQAKIGKLEGSFLENDYQPGDGIVTKASFLGDENVAQGNERPPGLISPITYRSVTLLPETHIDLTSSPAFVDNLLHILLEE